MAPRRPRAGSSAGNHRQKGTPRKNEASPSLALASPNLAHAPTSPGMSDAARYEQNLKVLRIRDRTIKKIIDQFSHVCLYDHNGAKWEKRGFEGSMFLVERDTEPRYGYYILNRESPQDVNEVMYPEDDLEVHGQYLMYRTYPEYTEKRIARIRANGGVDPLAQATDDPHASKKNTPSKTIGLWMFNSGNRESLSDVMVRLHSYIVKGLPYPEEYHHSYSGRSHPMTSIVTNAHSVTTSTNGNGPAQQQHDIQPPTQHSTAPSGSVSELDALFARLGSAGPTSPPTSRHAPAPSASALPSTKPLSVSNLFNSATPQPASSLPYNPPPGSRGPSSRVSSQHEIPGNISVTSPTSEAPVRGLALLDSIFASASAAESGSAPPVVSPSYQQREGEMNTSFRFPRTGPDLQPASPYPPVGFPGYSPGIVAAQGEIHSPKPVHSALPEVLSFEQISEQDNTYSPAMGAGRSGGSITGSSRPYRSGQSGLHRYDGDNEGSENWSASNLVTGGGTVLDEEAQETLPLGTHPPVLAARGVGTEATPRPPLKGISSATPPTLGVQSPAALHSVNSTSSIATITATNGPAPPSNGAPSFEDSSDLWMGGGPLDDRSSEVESEVIELDFADTSALSDPAIFSESPKSPRSKRKGKKEKKEKAAAAANATPNSATTNTVTNGHGKSKGKQKNVVSAGNSTSTVDSSLDTNSVNGVSTVVQPDTARSSLLDLLFQQPSKPARNLSKNDFLREIATLIRTDKSFGEKLYAEYMARI